MGSVKLQHGDCMELMQYVNDRSIDLIVTDIPYGEVNRKSNGLRNLDKGAADVVDFNLDDLVRLMVSKVSGSIYVFCGTEQVSTIRRVMVEMGLSTRVIVWEKSNPSPMNGDCIWLSGVELCVYGKRGGATFNAHCRNTVLKYPCGKHDLHPTQKPLDLIADLVKVSSNEGQTVMDPFMGSGTTGVVCVNLKRNFIGIEKNDDYFNIASKRIEGVLDKLAG